VVASDARPLGRSFFEREPVICARELVGCTIGFGSAAGIIVETEAYAAEGDPACHTWKRQGARDFVATNAPGTAYVYLNYGMHWLFNLLVKGGDADGFVLIRALEPIEGIPSMKRRRGMEHPASFCNGPAKLTQALGITGKHHGSDPLAGKGWKLLPPEIPVEIAVSTRIGISQAADFPWRFTLRGSPFVSRPA
jgi:DNA-3-methyladenine glycosylase